MSISFFSLCFVLVPIFFSSTGLRIRVCKREELEAHFSVHHLALFFKPRRRMFLCSFHGPMSVALALLTIRACLGFEFFCCFGALFFCVFFERFINRDDLPVQVYTHQVRHLCLHEAGLTWPFCPLVPRHASFNVVAHQLHWTCAVIHRKKCECRREQWMM